MADSPSPRYQYQNGHNTQHKLPKRIILVRHGESQGNTDQQAYSTTPDHKIPLTQFGATQSRNAGAAIRRLLDSDPNSASWRVYFYVSPYERARSTLREIGRSFSKDRIIGVREECRIREQDFGNFQVAGRMKVIKETRQKFGRFFYRFPEGESAADVYDRVSRKGKMESMNVHLGNDRRASTRSQGADKASSWKPMNAPWKLMFYGIFVEGHRPE